MSDTGTTAATSYLFSIFSLHRCDQLTNLDYHAQALLFSLHINFNCNIEIRRNIEKKLDTKENFGCKPSESSLNCKFPENSLELRKFS